MKIAVLPLASSPIKSQNRWSVEVPSDPLWHPCNADNSQAKGGAGRLGQRRGHAGRQSRPWP